MDVTIAPESALQRASLAGGRGSSPSAETQPDGAGLVDRRGLAGLAGRRCLLGRRGACRRFPAHPRTLERTPRAERSDRKTTAPPSPQRKPPIQARGSGYRFKIPQVCTAQQNTNQNQGHRLPKSGGHHNRRPTGGVRLSTKLIRCNDYPTSAAPAEPLREANTQMGFLGKAATRRRRREERAAFEEAARLAAPIRGRESSCRNGDQAPKPTFGDFCSATPQR